MKDNGCRCFDGCRWFDSEHAGCACPSREKWIACVDALVYGIPYIEKANEEETK